MIPLKLVGHFYIDGYGIVTTYEDGYGVQYSTVSQEIFLPKPVNGSRLAIVFDVHGHQSHKATTPSRPKPESLPLSRIPKIRK